jgi:hypothetical protein
LTTPGKLVLRRKEPETVVISKDGYESQQVHLAAELNPWVWGNIVFGGIIGVFVDWGTGACDSLRPAVINVTLNSVPGTATSPAAAQPVSVVPNAETNPTKGDPDEQRNP